MIRCLQLLQQQGLRIIASSVGRAKRLHRPQELLSAIGKATVHLDFFLTIKVDPVIRGPKTAVRRQLFLELSSLKK